SRHVGIGPVNGGGFLSRGMDLADHGPKNSFGAFPLSSRLRENGRNIPWVSQRSLRTRHSPSVPKSPSSRRLSLARLPALSLAQTLDAPFGVFQLAAFSLGGLPLRVDLFSPNGSRPL